MSIPALQTRRRNGLRAADDIAYVLEPVGWHRFLVQFGRATSEAPNTGLTLEMSRETPVFISCAIGTKVFFLCLFGTQESI